MPWSETYFAQPSFLLDNLCPLAFTVLIDYTARAKYIPTLFKNQVGIVCDTASAKVKVSDKHNVAFFSNEFPAAS
jgi:hypothetical protein